MNLGSASGMVVFARILICCACWGLGQPRPNEVREQIRAHDKRSVPGLVRISFGLYNETDEIDVLLDALQKISRGEFKGDYTQHKASGEYRPKGWSADFQKILYP